MKHICWRNICRNTFCPARGGGGGGAWGAVSEGVPLLRSTVLLILFFGGGHAQTCGVSGKAGVYTGKITTLQFSGQYILHEAGRRTVWTEPPEDCTLFHEAVHQKLLKPAHPRQLVFEHCLCSLTPSSDTVVCAFTRATGRQECPSQGEVGGEALQYNSALDGA